MKMIDQKNPRPSAVGFFWYTSLERFSAQSGQAAAIRAPSTTEIRSSQRETRLATSESYRKPASARD